MSFDILRFDILSCRYIATSIFCDRYFALDILSFDNLRIRYFAIRYFAHSIFCLVDILHSIFCLIDILRFDILSFDILSFDILSGTRGARRHQTPSVRLQSHSQDLLQALDSVSDAVEVLQSLREDDKFHSLFDGVEEAVSDVPMPRWAKVANARNNCAREYYRINVYLAFIDTCLGQINERFRSHLSRGVRLSALLPTVCTNSRTSFEELRPAVDMYSRLLDCSCDQVRQNETKNYHLLC